MLGMDDKRNIPSDRLWPLDSQGFILNDARRELIRSPFEAAVLDAVQAYIDHIGEDIDSIYVTGSVARGTAVAGESDLNMFAVTADTVDPELVLQEWVYDAEADLLDQHPCLSDVQLEIWPYYYVFNDPARFSIGAFILKTHSVCVWGSDLAPQLPEFRMSPPIANDDLVQIEADIDTAIEEIEAYPQPDNVRHWCRHAAKQILRAGFGLAQMESGVHTRDVDLCYTYFAEAYPDHAGAMRGVLDVAFNPVDDADRALHWLQTVRGWLLPLVDAWLDDHNPDRNLALVVGDQEEME